MELAYQDKQFCCWGMGSQGGAYLLRVTVSQRREVQFGRFLAGEPIEMPPGDYLYVGSAQAQKGSSSLARRLLRHASRSDAQNPHPIRQKMLTLFPKIGLGPTPLCPPAGKKLRWHVDFLLEEPGVDLTAVYLMRTSKEKPLAGSVNDVHLALNLREIAGRALETAAARWLLSFPEVVPLARGLGSTDDPGGTHLLAVTAVAEWWTHFPQQLTNFLQDGLA